eukprot:TRINITY_DN2751_c0_g1_i2.p2 TRINITY_DN2751_c0_g1~~TRINITY_DN2751_c0_g1_i2.p2  ORF type:complete len:126 (+),score=42.23 TRINITY_DN2751_c0_g1_i2:541-918(+)
MLKMFEMALREASEWESSDKVFPEWKEGDIDPEPEIVPELENEVEKIAGDPKPKPKKNNNNNNVVISNGENVHKRKWKADTKSPELRKEHRRDIMRRLALCAPIESDLFQTGSSSSNNNLIKQPT